MPDAAEIPDRALQSALEFAVGIAAVGAKLRPALPYPSGLKPFLKFHKLPATALSAARTAIEGDAEYLGRLAMVATDELIDEIGMLWITRPDGWVESALGLVAIAEHEREVIDDAGEVRREQRRREAAETAAARARLEVAEVREAFARESEALRVLSQERDRLAKELATARARVRELESGVRRRAAGASAATTQAEAAQDEIVALRAELDAAIAARDAALSGRAAEPASVDLDRMRALLLEALSLTGERGSPPARKRRAPARRPLAIPGGVYGDSDAAAEHLLRSLGVTVLVDGYNVAKLGWPDVELAHQRELCVEAAERLARRWGVSIHIVFDGADIVGAHTSARRLVRVSYSPSGVLADDVLRAEVRALDTARPVVVVTNDQAVLTDVRAAGANTVASDTFLSLARH